MRQQLYGVRRRFAALAAAVPRSETTAHSPAPQGEARASSTRGGALALCVAAGCVQGEEEPAGPLIAPSHEPASVRLELEPTPVELTQGAVDFEPTLASIQALVFTPACATAGCHDAEVQAGALDLSSAEASYDSLLGIDELGVPAANTVAAENRWLRVKPGEPERSFLYRKMTLPGVGEGAPMPMGDMQVSEPYMQQIRDWIEAGAEP